MQGCKGAGVLGAGCRVQGAGANVAFSNHVVAKDFTELARSAASNIAEGFGRYKHRDFARFLRISMGSLKEVADLLIDGHHRCYVSDGQLATGPRLVKRSKSACAKLALYLDNSPDRE